MDNFNNLYSPIRERIFTRAKSKALSQKEFAKAIKVSPQVVTDWKSGRISSFMKKLSPIAETLGTSEVWLLTGKEEISDDDTIQRLDSIADSLGVHLFDLLGIGSKLDLYRVSIDDLRRKDGGEISAEDKQFLKEMTAMGPRQLYDKLGPGGKRDFWRLFQDYFQDASIGRSWSKAKPTPVAGDGLSEEQRELLNRYDAASPALRAAALAVLRSGEDCGKAPGDVSTGR